MSRFLWVSVTALAGPTISSCRAWSRFGVALALAGLTVLPCRAASLQADELRILGKALSFVDPPLPAQPTVAIVYADGDAASRRDAEGLAEQIHATGFGGVPVTPLVVGSLSLAAARFQLIIAASGVDGEAVIDAARTHRALCVTADVEAVRDGHCTMAIRTSGHVEIFVSRDAASRSGVGFATAFRIMVHEQ